MSVGCGQSTWCAGSPSSAAWREHGLRGQPQWCAHGVSLGAAGADGGCGLAPAGVAHGMPPLRVRVVRVDGRGSAPAGVAHGVPPSGVRMVRVVGCGVSPSWCCAWRASFGVRWCGWSGAGSAPAGVAHGLPPSGCGSVRVVGCGSSPSWCCAWRASFGVRMVRVGGCGFSPSWCCAWPASFGVRMVRGSGAGSAPAGVAHGLPSLGCGWCGGRVRVSPSWCCAWPASFAGADGAGDRVRGQPQLVLRMACLLGVRDRMRVVGGRVQPQLVLRMACLLRGCGRSGLGSVTVCAWLPSRVRSWWLGRSALPGGAQAVRLDGR